MYTSGINYFATIKATELEGWGPAWVVSLKSMNEDGVMVHGSTTVLTKPIADRVAHMWGAADMDGIEALCAFMDADRGE